MQEAVKCVLGRESRDKNRFDALFAYAKNKLTDFRTEERRKVAKGIISKVVQNCILFVQVVGLGVYAKYSYYDTKTLHDHLIHSLQSESESTNYIKHLAILVWFNVSNQHGKIYCLLCFIAQVCEGKSSLTNKFLCQWIDKFYSNLTGDKLLPKMRILTIL